MHLQDKIAAMRRILDWATEWDRFESDEEREALYWLLYDIEEGSIYD